MRLLLAFVLVLANGCAFTRLVPPQRVDQMTVEFEHEVSGSDEAFALHCVKKIVDTWESDHHRTARPGRVGITWFLHVYEGGEHLFNIPPWVDKDPWLEIRSAGKRAKGFYIAEKRLMRCTAGRFGTIHILYHELCHMNLAPEDADHLDPRWSEWDARMKELKWELIGDWFDWKDQGLHDKYDRAAELAAQKREAALRRS